MSNPLTEIGAVASVTDRLASDPESHQTGDCFRDTELALSRIRAIQVGYATDDPVLLHISQGAVYLQRAVIAATYGFGHEWLQMMKSAAKKFRQATTTTTTT